MKVKNLSLNGWVSMCDNIALAKLVGIGLAWFLHSLFEMWIGKNKKYKSNSTWELIINFLKGRKL